MVFCPVAGERSVSIATGSENDWITSSPLPANGSVPNDNRATEVNKGLTCLILYNNANSKTHIGHYLFIISFSVRIYVHKKSSPVNSAFYKRYVRTNICSSLHSVATRALSFARAISQSTRSEVFEKRSARAKKNKSPTNTLFSVLL